MHAPRVRSFWQSLTTAKYPVAPSPSVSNTTKEPIFKDIPMPEIDSPFIIDTKSKSRFSEAHNKIFDK